MKICTFLFISIIKRLMNMSNIKELEEKIGKLELQKRINFLSQKYKSKKVLIYGAGDIASIILDNYDLSGLDIAAFTDIKFIMDDKTSFRGYKVISPLNIADIKFDIILLNTFRPAEIAKYIIDNIFIVSGEYPIDNILCDYKHY